jgi:NAD(P)-dependent dehydrogenase (short-subunit alcohol dehydrogenase family)
MRFEGKVAVVTGAAQGIGEGYARGLAERGAAVAVADIALGKAEAVAAAINADGGKAVAVAVDVADETSAQQMAAAVAAELGGIDLLVNNAAIYGGMKIESLLKVDLDYWHRFMSVNLDGALIVTRACVPHMVARGGGAIVNQSSTAAWMAGGYYSIAKAAINSLTASLAAELSWQNIRVNAIAPGPTDTEATRSVVPAEFTDALVQSLMIKRLGTPGDLVGACAFLLSDDAAWMTGQIISVDGGQIVRI